MKEDQYEISQLKLVLAQEEFRYWDACRNGCSPATLDNIRKSIETVRSNITAFEMIIPQTSLS